MYKGKKYNFIVILLLFIISAVAGVSAGMNAGAISSGPNAPGNEQTDNDVEETPEAPSDLKAPSASAKPLTKLLFAIDVLNNGKGFRSESHQVLRVNTLGIEQHMQFEKLSGGGLDLVQEWFKMDGPLSGNGKNEYRVQFSDGSNIRTKTIADRGKFNYDSKTVEYGASGKLESVSVHDYENVQDRFPLNDLFINIDKGSVGQIREDKRSDANNYIITVQLNIAGLSQKYLNTFTANGGDSVTLDAITLKFKVSKKTGFLRQTEKEEHFRSAYGPFKGSATTTLREVYHEMNVSKEAEIKKISGQIFG